MRVAKTLIDRGITLQKIRKSITYLKKNMPDVEKPLSELKFLTDGSTVFVITGDDKQIVNTLKKGQLVFAIALGDPIEELKRKVIDIEKERKYAVAVRAHKYPVILRADTEDGEYVVERPSLPGCTSRDDTVEEALDMIKDAHSVGCVMWSSRDTDAWRGKAILVRDGGERAQGRRSHSVSDVTHSG
jgi:hypothetical protein